MRTNFWILLAVGLMVGSFARADKDTIPLNQFTKSGAETEDSTLLAPPKQQLKTKPSKPAATSGPSAKTTSGGNEPYVATLDVFGTTRLNESKLREFLGSDLDSWIKKGLKGDPTSVELEKKIKEKLKKQFGFALAEWSIVQFFEPGNLALHITLDVVEPGDQARRMPFLPQPTAELADPDGLIKSWLEYENTALELVDKGQLQPDSTECVALHCPFGHKVAQLKKYESIFVEGVKKNEAAIVKILKEDKRVDFRASAVYLLAYLKDGKKVVSNMVERIKDPEDLVRNNSLRVLGDIAEYHHEFVIPVRPVVEALAFPRVSDRSKAVYALFQLVANSQSARDEVRKYGLPDLLKLMESKQPDHKELAHNVLRKVSGKEYAVTDLRSWSNWVSKAAAQNKDSDRSLGRK